MYGQRLRINLSFLISAGCKLEKYAIMIITQMLIFRLETAGISAPIEIETDSGGKF
jgi:hypothetical protein